MDVVPDTLRNQSRSHLQMDINELFRKHDPTQPPSPGRSQMMKTAALEDATQLKMQLKGLNAVSDSVLRVINLHTTTSV
jgi:hypothetical protein